METKEYVVYSFEELDDDAKEKATQKLADPNIWEFEYRESLKTFLRKLNIELDSWYVMPFGSIDYVLDRRRIHEVFRGIKHKTLLKLDECPTGFCADYALYKTLKEKLRNRKSIYEAIDSALYKFFREWRDSMEFGYSEDYIAEVCSANGIKFFKNGDIAP